jgi:hypothetical protein
MRHWRRLFFYLLLNVFISACTTLLVLNLWDRAQNPGAAGFFPFVQLAGSPVSTQPGIGNVPPQTEPTPFPVSAPQPTYQTYQVAANDTFESIAQRFGISVPDLLAANGFTSVQALGPGEVLRIPPITPTPLPQAGLRVQGVLGPGDLASERVVLRQVGEGQVNLTGWTLEDMSGNVFPFPMVELVNDNSQLEIYTRAGANTAGRLYWGLSEAIWSSGETLTLRDSTGLLRLTYQIP